MRSPAISPPPYPTAPAPRIGRAAGFSPAVSSSHTRGKPSRTNRPSAKPGSAAAPAAPKAGRKPPEPPLLPMTHPSAPSMHTQARGHTSRRTAAQKPAHQSAHRIRRDRDRSLPNNKFNNLKLPDFLNKTREIGFTPIRSWRNTTYPGYQLRSRTSIFLFPASTLALNAATSLKPPWPR
jgi:hypothetical protein